MPYKNAEDRKEQQKRYRAEHRLELNAWRKQYRKRVGRKKYPEKEKEWRLKNLDKCALNATKGRAKAKYGIPRNEFDALRETAKTGTCEICSKPARGKRCNGILHMDHCHKIGKFRGLLCHKCNARLDMLEKNLDWFVSAINYLQKHSQKEL
jgi:Recombination endonuclease VII